MQSGSLYLYPSRMDVFSNLDDWILERNRTVYQRNLKLYRGSDNRLEFKIKNSDHKPRNILGRSFVFTITSQETNRQILQKDCMVDDVALGKINVVFTRDELYSVEPGLYKYSLVAEKRSYQDFSSYTVLDRMPVFTDTQYGSYATLEIHGDLAGDAIPSLEITEFSRKIDYYQTNQKEHFISSAIPAFLSTNQSLHTFQFFCSGFTGRITIQGCLENGSSPNTWFNIAHADYYGITNEYMTVKGRYNWLRVRYEATPRENFGLFIVDQTIYGRYNVGLGGGGRGYNAGDIIVIPGSQLGGERPTHDLKIRVESTNSGSIQQISWSGLSQNGVRQFQIDQTKQTIGRIERILYR